MTTTDNLTTTRTATGTYRHLPGRDLDADWNKARRSFRARMRPRPQPAPALGPAWGEASILGRTLRHLERRLEREGEITVSLWQPRAKDRLTREFNREVEGWARSGAVRGRVRLRYLDPDTGEVLS
jgi:hypothetical protein